MSEKQENPREDIADTGVSTGRRRARLNEADRGPAPEQRDEESQAGGNPNWPAQYEGDGLDELPVQMRP